MTVKDHVKISLVGLIPASILYTFLLVSQVLYMLISAKTLTWNCLAMQEPTSSIFIIVLIIYVVYLELKH